MIVVRPKDRVPFSEPLPGRDKWGWEPADGIILEEAEARKMMKEYAEAMPQMTVRMRPL